jgi:glycosyltransferase involved in cell wall biosynthesis
MKVLSFGHIPKWAGGRQDSGLANAIYQIAKNLSLIENTDVALVATDVYKNNLQDGKLSIFGWTKTHVLLYMLLNPIISVRWFYYVIIAKIKYGPIVSVLAYFFKGLHLHNNLTHWNPDIVHLHSMTACVYDKIIPSETKIIVTIHGLVGNNISIPNHKYLSKMEKDCYKSNRYFYITFVSKQLIPESIRIYGKILSNTIAIPNAYDNRFFKYIKHQSQDEMTLLTIASLSALKGQHRVLEAIYHSGVKVRYICVGAGEEKIKAELIEYAKFNKVDFLYLGKKSPSEIREVLSKTDYMILPSTTEGFGIVFLEALACGTPIILPKNLPIVSENEIIKPGFNSILLDDSSSDSIAKVLPTLKDFNFDRFAISQDMVKFSWENVAIEYKNIMQQYHT